VLPKSADEAKLEQAARLLAEAKKPGIFVGWGAVDVVDHVVRIAEFIGAPVSTTLQGLSAFPGDHPLHVGMGFSRAAVPAAERAFEGCDCLLAIGTRFGEIPTGSFGCVVPENLIHVDIDPGVLSRNFPAKVAIQGDSRTVLPALAQKVQALKVHAQERKARLEKQIAEDKRAYAEEWLAHTNERVNPKRFFDSLRKQLAKDAITVVDDGNHTFLAAELFKVHEPRSFVSPTDFNCMGYSVPAAIGAKLVNPDRQVVGIVGDGAFLMTGLEMLTATTEGAGVAYFVFSDGELSQISQGQCWWTCASTTRSALASRRVWSRPCSRASRSATRCASWAAPSSVRSPASLAAANARPDRRAACRSLEEQVHRSLLASLDVRSPGARYGASDGTNQMDVHRA
jgi:acetolactate synthase-1/2/3 large subunit